MTNRLAYKTAWAADGVVADPDLDTTAPSYKPDRYENIGWEAEKPPEEWQNFLSQITDAKIIETLVHGILLWDETVSYSVGSVVSSDGVLYIKVSSTATKLPPSNADSGWLVASAMKYIEYEELMAWISAHLSDHLRNLNPHRDSMSALVGGGYEKEETLKFFLDDKDPRTIGYHKLQMGAAVHNTTCEQLNMLPKAGGVFTGPVAFLADVLINAAGDGKMFFNKSTARLELNLKGISISIDTNGTAWVTSGGRTSIVMTEANYPEMQMRAGFAFALPLPFFRISFQNQIDDFYGIGWSQVNTAQAPVYSFGGLRIVDGIIVSKTSSMSTNTTLYVRYCTSAGVVKSKHLQYGAVGGVDTNVKSLVEDVMKITDAFAVFEIRFYQRLSLYQISMLE